MVPKRILKATIEQSSAVPCDDTTISVCVRTNAPFFSENKTLDVNTDKGFIIQVVPVYANINVKGLAKPGGGRHYETPSGQIPITGLGQHANLFGMGNWSADTGELNIAIRGRAENHTDVCFNFTLKNPSSAEECAPPGRIKVNITKDSADPADLYYPKLAAFGNAEVRVRTDWATPREDGAREPDTEAVATDYYDLDGQGGCPALGWGAPLALSGGRCPLKVVTPQVVYSDIGQSDPFPCSDNTITVNVTFNVPLLCPCGASGIPKITVSGLAGTLSTEFSNLSLTVGGAPGIGTWNPNGELVAHLGSAECALGYKRENGTYSARTEQAGVTTNAACAKACNDDDTCLSYEFSEAEQKCYLNDQAYDSTTPAPRYTLCVKTAAWVPQPCTVLALQFTVRNVEVARAAAQASLAVCSISGGAAAPLVNPSKNDLAPLFVRTGAIAAKMCQSNPWPGAQNTLTVTLTANIPLRTACQSKVVISNLDQACMEGVSDFTADGTVFPAACYSPGTLALNSAADGGTDGGLVPTSTDFGAGATFQDTAGWSYDYDAARQVHGGKLTLTVLTDTAVDTEYVFSFTIRNPSFGQASPPIRVGGTGIPIAGMLVEKCDAFITSPDPLNTCAGTPLSCNVDAADAAPLGVRSPEFLEHQIGQSTPYPCVVDNVIYVTLRANVNLPVQTSITLTNLDGIALDSGYIDVAIHDATELSSDTQLLGPGDADAYTAPAGSGMWDADLKKMTVQVAGAPISAFKRFTFKFTVTNPCCEQPSPAVCVKVNRITAPCNNCTAVGNCGSCVSIPRQMLDRDYYTIFNSPSDGGYYNYNNSYYSKDSDPITFGKAQLGDAYPLRTYEPGFIPLKKAIGQSTPFPSANNTITLTLATVTPLTAGSKVTLQGLDGSASASHPALPIQDAGTAEGLSATAVFGATADWQQAGTLVLTVASDSIAGAQYVLSFTLTNHHCERAPRTVTMTAGCCPDSSCSYSMVLDPEVNKTSTCQSTMGDTQPLKVLKPAFVMHNIWQSNPFPCQNNTISLELQTNVDLLATTKITVEGLEGSDTVSTNENTSLAVDVCGTETPGEWDQVTGRLVFELQALQPACSACVVKFVLKNKCCCQASPIGKVTVDADMNCFEKKNALPLGAANVTLLEASVKRPVAEELKPLHIRCPEWDATAISQSSEFPCADNVITVNVSFNVPVYAGSDMKLTLTGIHDTQTPTTYPPYVVSNITNRHAIFNFRNVTVFNENGTWVRNDIFQIGRASCRERV